MRILLDTHLLLWAASGTDPRMQALRTILLDPSTQPCFSVASIWEVVIKSALGREGFRVDPTLLRRGLLDNEYEELDITGAHVLRVAELPPLHRDPFDRLLVAQALCEEIPLFTADPVVARYPGPIRLA